MIHLIHKLYNQLWCLLWRLVAPLFTKTKTQKINNRLTIQQKIIQIINRSNNEH